MTTPTDEDWTKLLTQARRRWAGPRDREATVLADTYQLAADAIADGVSERQAAELLGINRMSLRAALGKGEG